MIGGEGQDSIFGEGGDDSLAGGSDDDSIVGGTGNDVIYGDTNGGTTSGGGGGTGEELLQNGSFEDGTHSANTVNGLTGWTTTSGSPDSADDGTGSESWNPSLDANDGTGYVTMWSSNSGPQEAIQQTLGTALEGGESYTLNFSASTGQYTGGQWFTPADIPVTFQIVDAATGNVIGSTTVQGTDYEDYSIEFTPPSDVSTIVLRPLTQGVGNNPSITLDSLSLTATNGDPADDGEDGNDTILGGEGQDTIFGEGGDDSIEGGSDDDLIYGDTGGTGGGGGSGPELLQNGSFEDGTHSANTVNGLNGWSTVSGSPDSADDGTGSESWNPSLDANDGTGYVTMWSSNSGPQEAIQQTLGTALEGGESYTLNFSASTGQYINGQWFTPSDIPVSFEIVDAATGNVIGTTIVQGTDYEDYSIEFTPPSDVSAIQLRPNTTGVGNNPSITLDSLSLTVTDTDTGAGEGGDDTIIGGEGADAMFGEGGDDTFIVSSGADGDGDVIDGGNGPDETTDNDVLDLRGAGVVTIDETADANDDGATSGTVTFADGSTLTFEGIETILTDPQNGGPTANDDTVTVDEDDTVTFNPTANDTDPDGDLLTVIDITEPTNGTLIDNGDGTYTYEPDPDYNGPDSVTYTVQDPSGETSTATVTFNVTPVNDGPDAVNDSDTTDEDTAVTVDLLANDTDVEGDTLTVTGATVPADQGTLVDNGDGTVTFTPAENFNGTATISYSITDGNGGTDTAIHEIEVAAVNDDPVAVDDLADTDEDTAVTIDLIGNDTDVDGDPLTIGTVTVPADQGTVVDNGDGTVTFTPAPNFNGPATISYTVVDGQGGEDDGEATVNVAGVNDGPTANDDSDTTDEDTPITVDLIGNDTDEEGDPLTVTAVSVPADQGTIVDNGDGTATFTPAPNFNGTATISYSITDGNGGTDSAEHTVNVTPVNDDPVAVDDLETTDEDQPVTIDLIGNDTDVDGDPLTIGTVTVPADQGTVVDNGDGTVTFTPAPNFNGPATITYTVVDGQGGEDEGEAVVSVGAVNDGPVANDDTATTDEDTPVTVDLIGNDTDADGDPLTVINATVPADQGTLVDNGDGTVTFTPAPDFNGEATISYEISDGNGGTDTAVHVVTVSGVNDGPDAVDDDAGEVVVGNTITIDALANDTDPEDDPLTITNATVSPQQGVVAVVANQIEFTPNPDFEGTATINYMISDGNGGTDTAQITVHVRDGIVTGTDDGDLIDENYTGDPGNDMVDNADNVLSAIQPKKTMTSLWRAMATIPSLLATAMITLMLVAAMMKSMVAKVTTPLMRAKATIQLLVVPVTIVSLAATTRIPSMVATVPILFLAAVATMSSTLATAASRSTKVIRVCSLAKREHRGPRMIVTLLMAVPATTQSQPAMTVTPSRAAPAMM